MAKDFSKSFYNSTSWKKTRNAYFNEKYGLCELCNKAGEEVHHIIPLSPSNINDPNITLNWDNLQLLCRSCHELVEEKARALRDGLVFTEDGQLKEVSNDITNTY